MLKKIFFILFVVLAATYIFVVFVISPEVTKDDLCNDIQVVLSDSEELPAVVTVDQMKNHLKKNNIVVSGYKVSDIDVDYIEKVVMKHPLIRQSECYISPENSIIIEIWQKNPLVRVLDARGTDYYIDSDGFKIENIDNFVSYLPLVTGFVDYEYIRKELFGFLKYISDNKFWSSQINQIYVKENKDIILVPRVGYNTIMLGQVTEYETKLDKVLTFYEKGLSVVGWNKYKNINVEFEGQVIAEKN